MGIPPVGSARSRWKSPSISDSHAPRSPRRLSRGRDLKAAVEGAENFCISNNERIRGKCGLDLDIDPPADLAIEVVVSVSVRKSMEIYRRLGVAETWIAQPPTIRESEWLSSLRAWVRGELAPFVRGGERGDGA